MSGRRPSIGDGFLRAARFLGLQEAPFIAVGGIAAGLQWQPRSTDDVDLMIDSTYRPRWQAARAEGFDVEPEVADSQWLSSGFVRLWLGTEGRRVAVDFMACDSEFLREVISRSRPILFCGFKVPIASAEDLILFKLAAGRQRHLVDIEAAYRWNKDRLDTSYLRKWAAWFASKNPYFREMPERLEALLGGRPLPPANPR